MQSTTNRDVPMNLWGASIVIPKGTRIHLVKSGGTPKEIWVVSNIESWSSVSMTC